MIDEVASPEESLWRAVLIRYSSDVFKLKVEMNKARDNMTAAIVSGNKSKLSQYRKSYEHYAFKMQKFKNELEPSKIDNKMIIIIEEICDHANVPFNVFKSRIIDIMSSKLNVPSVGKKYMFNS